MGGLQMDTRVWCIGWERLRVEQHSFDSSGTKRFAKRSTGEIRHHSSSAAFKREARAYRGKITRQMDRDGQDSQNGIALTHFRPIL